MVTSWPQGQILEKCSTNNVKQNIIILAEVWPTMILYIPRGVHCLCFFEQNIVYGVQGCMVKSDTDNSFIARL